MYVEIKLPIAIDTNLLNKQRSLIGKLVANLECGRTGISILRDLDDLRGIQSILSLIGTAVCASPVNEDEGPECPGCTNPNNCEDCEYQYNNGINSTRPNSLCDRDRERFNPVDVDVIFLKDYDDGDIYAVFPGLAATDVLVTCYDHHGQHSGCALWYCVECIEVTEPSEYADLAVELESRGYNIQVISKDQLYALKYQAARAAQLNHRTDDEDS